MSGEATSTGILATANGEMVTDLVVSSDTDNMVPLPVNMGRLTVNVDAPEQYAGRYSVQSDRLDDHPMNMGRPQIEYDAASGTLNVVRSGLWAHDDRLEPPKLTIRWRRDGTILKSERRTTYVLGPDDYGRTFQLRERARDANGRRNNNSLSITVPVRDPFEVVVEADGTLRIDGNDGRTFVVDQASAAFAGSYSVPPSGIVAGPMPLVPPVLDVPTTVAPGVALAITPALFAYDPDLGAPVISYSNGVDASDPANPVYVVQAGDQGGTVTITATAMQGALATESTSNGVSIPAAPPPPPDIFEVVLEADGTLRIDGNDGRTFMVDQASTAFAGSYSVLPGALVAGPVALVPPVLEVPTTATPGVALAINPALFAYDPDLGAPVISYSNGVDASDPANPVYVVQAGDQGGTVTITATAMQGALATESTSNGVNVPAAPPPPDLFEVVVEADGTLRIDGNDGRTFMVDQASTAFAGSYSVLPGALVAGPVALVPPVLEVPTTVAPGVALAITPALFAYDPDLGVPVISYSNGVDATNPDVPIYVIQQGDEGTNLSITAIASQGALDTASSSNELSVP